MYTHQIVTEAVITRAKYEANIAALAAKKADTTDSNGSEAWQAVILETKGQRKLQNELKALGVDKDSYWGYNFTPSGYQNYFAEEAWTKTFAKVLNENGIKCRRTERLL